MANFKAYPQPDVHGQAPRWLKVCMVAFDCSLIALQPILVQLSKNAEGTFSYNPVSANILIEVVKTTVALGVLVCLGTGQPGPPMYRSVRAFVRDGRHCRLLAVPAALYAVNNYLKFVMQLFFRPTSAKMIGNLKVLTIALLMRSLMGRSFSVLQWEALFLLVAGISVNQLSDCSRGGADAAQYSLPALLATLGTVTVPSAASVYNEMALKGDMDTSVHLQNFWLYFYMLVFNLLAMSGYLLATGTHVGASFAGFNGWVFILILNNAAQGILSSFFYKFADSILKKYSSTLATIFTGLMSLALFGHAITMNFAIGISIVLVSMHQFFSKPKEESSTRFVPSPSLDHFQLHVGGKSTVKSSSPDLAALAPLTDEHDVVLTTGSTHRSTRQSAQVDARSLVPPRPASRLPPLLPQ